MHALIVLAAAVAVAAPGVAAAAAAAGSGGAAEGPTADELKFLAWLKQQGAEFHVELRTENGVRGTYATKEMRKGDVIAKIPLKAAFWAPIDDAVEHLMEIAGDPANPLGPFLRTLPTLRAPGPGEPRVAHYSTIPMEYMHLVGGVTTAHRIAETQLGHKLFWAEHGMDLMRKGITASNFKAAVVTVARALPFDYRGEEHDALIPLVTAAGRRNGCSNWVSVQPCRLPAPMLLSPTDVPNAVRDKADPSQLCALWMSGGPAEPGDELCVSPSLGRPDLVFFQYGVNMQAAPPLPLALEDMPNLEELVDEEGNLDGALLSADFSGDVDELQAEVKRLGALLESLEDGLAAAAKTPEAADDPGGAILRGLQRLWELRREAVAGERARLEARMSEDLSADEL